MRGEQGATPGSTSWVHPRVHGEQSAGPGVRRRGRGPSPRARGAAHHPHPAAAPHGSTPACTGSSPWSTVTTPFSRVHPRVRGEQSSCCGAPYCSLGPSPGARGAASGDRKREFGVGSIPACTGSSATHARPASECRVHPHERGERVGMTGRGLRALGPSPRARGAGRLVRPDRRPGGSIPACAGSSRLPPGAGAKRGVHPRVRREQDVLLALDTDLKGPFPRARGHSPALHLGLLAVRALPQAGFHPVGDDFSWHTLAVIASG